MEGNDFLVNETGVAEACHLGYCWLQEKYLELDLDTGWPVIMLYDEPNSSWRYYQFPAGHNSQCRSY